MEATSADLFDRGLDFFGGVVSRLTAADWDRPSPCAGWSALDVLGHLSTALRMGISVLGGEQPEWPTFERPAELVSGDPATFWSALVGEARSALDGADLDLVMETPMGPRTVRDRLAFPAIDLYVHAWDVGRAAGIEVEIPTEVASFAHAYIDPMPAEMVRGEGGAFGPEAEAPPDATPTEAFVAWTGRSPR